MGRTGGVVAPAGVTGALIITSKTLPAAIKTSVCTRGAAGTVVAPATCTPGTGLPSSAINVNPLTCIHQASQDRAGDSGRDGTGCAGAGCCCEQRSGRIGLVERDAVDQVVKRRVVHRRRIAGVIGG